MLRQEPEVSIKYFQLELITSANLLSFEKALSSGEKYIIADRESREFQILKQNLEGVIKSILSKSCVRTAKWLIRNVACDPKSSIYLDPEQVRYHRRKPLTREKSCVELVKDGKVVEVFEAVEVIGSGKYGVVRACVSTTNPDKQLAIKIPVPGRPVRATGEVRLVDIDDINLEVDLMSQVHKHGLFGVKHNIDKVTQGYSWCVVMPRYKGVSLKQIIDEIKDPKQLLLLALKVMESLHEVHARNIVHGDLLVQNILVNLSETHEYGMKTFEVRIVDFGKAMMRGTPFSGYQPVGVFAFAPELTYVENQKVRADTPQDIYTLAHSFNRALEKFKKNSGGDISKYDVLLKPLHRFINDGLTSIITARPLLIGSIYEFKNHLNKVTSTPGLLSKRI